MSSGTIMLNTNIVMIIANTPSVSASSRPLSKIKFLLSIHILDQSFSSKENIMSLSKILNYIKALVNK